MAACGFATRAGAGELPERPNIIFIMADDLGSGDLGCYGQETVRTPRIDRMAAEGIRFTQVYAGTSVCAPTRCVLMTGLHSGHAPIRANREVQPEGQMPIPAGYVTVGTILQRAGYATACVGKWGLGMFESPGSPLKRGFDHFYGYNCQRHAHDYYTDYFYDDAERIPLDGKTYSHDLLTAEALKWIKGHQEDPFFLYLPYTIPHGKYVVPDSSAYAEATFAGKPLTKRQQVVAAMITRMDGDVGRILDLLGELKIDKETIVFFTSDHGAARDFFNSNGPFRGLKRSMYEGGLRVPMVVRWPGVIPAGRVSDEIWAFWDVLPTLADLAGAEVPADANIDGHSIVPVLLGGDVPDHDYLYWELFERKFTQALRQGDWKIVHPGPRADYELYNLAKDIGERNDLADEYPEKVKKLTALMESARTPSELWPTDLGVKKKGKGRRRK